MNHHVSTHQPNTSQQALQQDSSQKTILANHQSTHTHAGKQTHDTQTTTQGHLHQANQQFTKLGSSRY